MFWDRAAGVYDIFANFINARTHRVLCEKVAGLIDPADNVLECACGTGLLSLAIAPRCHSLIATDFSKNMVKRTAKKCAAYPNITVREANILKLDFPDESFDVVVAGNVIHLLDEPYKALGELDRVCKIGGQIVIPTYMNKDEKGDAGAWSEALGKAGVDFKREFTFATYQAFFAEAGYENASYTMIEGRIPCALAVLQK